MTKTENTVTGHSISPSVIELSQNHDDFIVKFKESQDDRLEFPPTKIGERYLRSKLAVALELVCDFGGVKFGMFALVGFNNTFHLGRETPTAGCANQDELTMFVEDVHVMKNEQGIIDRVGGVVRLKRFDEAPNVGVCDSLYFSLVSGNALFIDRFLFKNGKLDTSRMASPVLFTRELPSEVVETRSQMMDDFSRKNAETRWDRETLMVLNCLKRDLLVVLGNNGVFVLLKKGCDLGIQIADTLVGPF